VGFLDRAKQLAEQARSKAEDALAEVRARSATPSESPPTAQAGTADPRMGTPYVPGMLGRPGWRERGLEDPAAVLPVADRDRAGVPHSTKSQVVEEPFGVGRRWSSGGRSAGLFYRLDPDQQAWEPPGGRSPMPEVLGATTATLSDGRTLVFLAAGDTHVVLELQDLDTARAALARRVAGQIAG
jgi:hypothetical protein